MKLLRLVLAAATTLLLMAGYLASQYSYFFASDKFDPSSYAARVDQPPVHNLAILLFVAAILMSLLPDREEGNI